MKYTTKLTMLQWLPRLRRMLSKTWSMSDDAIAALLQFMVALLEFNCAVLSMYSAFHCTAGSAGAYNVGNGYEEGMGGYAGHLPKDKDVHSHPVRPTLLMLLDPYASSKACASPVPFCIE